MSRPPESATQIGAFQGLASEQARELLERFGPNVLVPEVRRVGFLWLFLKGVTDPMAVLLAVAGATYALLGDTLEAAITLSAIVPVVAVGLVLERRAESALAKLREATRPTATVIRDGEETQLPAERVVPGDLVVVKEGDIVPADGVVIETTQLGVDESPLTGESLPVEKVTATGGRGEGRRDDLEVGSGRPAGVAEALLGQRERLWAGSVVLSGRAVMQVSSTGSDTAYGRLAAAVASAEEAPTPLQRSIRRLVWALAAVAAFFCGAVFVLELAYGHGLAAAVTAGVSLGIAAIPEEFPIVFTLYLSVGAWRLSRKRVLIRKLTSVEALGSTTVICTDKTGTLTEGKLVLSDFWAASGDSDDLLLAATYACEPDPFDALERAILDYAAEHLAQPPTLRADDLIADHEFDPNLKYMSHVWRVDGRNVTFAKGSPESILTLCRPDPATRERAESRAREMAGRGMRVIGVARGVAPPDPGNRDRDEAKLELVGLLAFSDEAREGVGEALKACAAAGIRVVMLTGDHPVTAAAVAEGLGLGGGRSEDGGHHEWMVTGDHLDSASDEEFDRLVKGATVVARLRPEQKHDIVRHLKRQGEVVAMTGDGINDAPALREADVGVAMGKRGTEVARESADMVILDDNFATIVEAVENGRRIFDNLGKAFSFLVAFHIPLLLGALVVPLVRKPLLFLPLHLVLLEIVLHPTVSLAFENEPADADVMSRPPRPPERNLVGLAQLVRPVASGLAVFGVTVGVYLAALARSVDLPVARSQAMTVLFAGIVAMMVAELHPREYAWRSRTLDNRAALPLAAAMVSTLLATVYFPPANKLLETAPLPALELAAFALAGLAAVSATEFLKKAVRS